MKRTALFSLLAVALLCMAGLCACSDEKTVDSPDGKVTVKETARGVQVQNKDGMVSMEGDEKSGKVDIKTEDGERIRMTYTKDKIVEGFPADIPVYGPAEIKMSQLMESKHAVATLGTRDTPEAILKFYKDAFPKNGWAIKQEMSLSGMTILHGTKDDRSLNVQIVRQDEETAITIAMSAGDE